MRLGDQGESRNVEDRRAGVAIGRGSIGVGTLVIAMAASYFLGIDPAVVLGLAGGTGSPLGGRQAGAKAAARRSAGELRQQGAGEHRDHLAGRFPGSRTALPGTEAGSLQRCHSDRVRHRPLGDGTFYCPSDEKVHIDLAFYRDLKQRFHAPGEFAQAYVIAHEVGHHVQKPLGISEKVRTAQAGSASQATANGLSVRLELQADCFAGVWGHRADSMQKILEPGEIEQALTAAAAIGDDRLQRQTQAQIVPESFTHGSSRQRVRWFKRGMATGDVRQCDTFSAASL